jgi:hypothetical protein
MKTNQKDEQSTTNKTPTQEELLAEIDELLEYYKNAKSIVNFVVEVEKLQKE